METAAGFDVVAVVARLARLRVGAASAEELRWADRATDRVRQVMDAWQSAVQFQMTLPPPLPADPAPTADADDAAPHDTAAAPDADQPAPLPTLGGGAAESPQEALRKLRRMRLLADLPAFLDALAAGRVSTQHVDLLASAVDKLPDAIRIRVLARGEELLRAACAGAADKFSRTVHRVVTKAYEDEGVDRTQRQRAESRLFRGVNDATGMHWLRVDIDPERGAQLFARLDSEREAIFHSGGFSGLNGEQVDLQALLDLLAAPGAEQQSSPRKAHVSVIIDIETLAIGAHDRMVCETSSGAQLPPDTVRNLICAAEIAFGFTVQGRVVRHLAKREVGNSRSATGDADDAPHLPRP